MTLSTNNTDLNVALHEIKQIETHLANATKSIEAFCEKHPDAFSSANKTLARYIKQEESQAQKWTQFFYKILDHSPCDFNELKCKTLVLLEYANAGHDDPKILKTIKQDMRMLSSEKINGQSQPHSFQLSTA